MGLLDFIRAKKYVDAYKAETTNYLALKANTADVNTQIASVASGSPKGVYTTVPALTTAFPTGTTGIYLVTGNVAEVASLTVTAAATVASNVTVTLNGVAITTAVLATDTAIQVADKVRATVYTGWTAGGTVGTTAVTFTSTTVGVKTDALYSAGTTGATGTMTTTTQGVDVDGKWYYWNGSTWTAGGVYQAVSIANLGISTNYIAEKAVTGSRTDFIDMSAQLIDHDTISFDVGRLTGTGTVDALSTTYGTSYFIPIIGGKTLIAGVVAGGTPSLNNICFYNVDKTFISIIGGWTAASFASPSNACFIKFSFTIGSVDIINIGLFYGVVGTDFSYYKKLSSSVKVKLASIENDWEGKTWLSYGDSITAFGNVLADGWQKYVHDYHKFSAYYGRGIGGQSFVWNTRPWFANADGSYNSRDDLGDMTNPASYTLPDGTTDHYGAMCSWDRITTMIRSAIKDSINLIYVTAGTNDSINGNPPVFTPNDETDLAWKNSAYYSTYGGDYNISIIEGAVASTIMKLQAWCPNAIIVLGTPLNGRGTTGQINTALQTDEYWKAIEIKEVADKMSIPVIDVNTTTGVNGLNRTSYITDTVHPNSTIGFKALARSVIGGLKTIMPNI